MCVYITCIMYGGLGSKLFTHIHVRAQFLYRLINLKIASEKPRMKRRSRAFRVRRIYDTPHSGSRALPS